MKLRWLAHNLLMLLLAGNFHLPFHTGWDCVIFTFFLTVLAGKKPSNMIAGWDFYFLKVLLASSEERVFFFPGKLNINISGRNNTLLAFTTLCNQFCEKRALIGFRTTGPWPSAGELRHTYLNK